MQNEAWRSFLWALDHSKGSMRPTRGLALGSACAILRVQILRAKLSEPATGRASPTLLFGLAPRGVCRASDVATGAVGSCPTVSPLPVRHLNRPARGFASCRPPSAILTGGLFSVALSVAEFSRIRLPGVTRRVALTVLNGGVRTFLQRDHREISAPAITRPARWIHYNGRNRSYQLQFRGLMRSHGRSTGPESGVHAGREALVVARRACGAYHFEQWPWARDAKARSP